MSLSKARSLFQFSLALLTIVSLLPSARAAKSPAAAAPGGTWKGYIAIDAATGRTLLEENADLVTPPASMTKLMTFAVLHDKLESGALSLSAPVKIMNDEITIKNIRVAISVGGTSDIGRQFFDLGPHKVWDEISSLLRKEIERGGLRNEDPDAMTTLLNALCEADTIRNLMGAGTPMSEKEMEQRAEYIVDIFLRAYGCKQQ